MASTLRVSTTTGSNRTAAFVFAFALNDTASVVVVVASFVASIVADAVASWIFGGLTGERFRFADDDGDGDPDDTGSPFSGERSLLVVEVVVSLSL